MKLLVDDCRSGIGYDIVARNAHAAIAVLNSNIHISEIDLDFDLGYGPTGEEVAKWIVDHADKVGPMKWFVVSDNPDGRVRLKSAMEHADKIWKDKVKL